MSVRIQKSQLKEAIKESLREILKEGSNPELRKFVKTCMQELLAEGVQINEYSIPQQQQQQMIPSYNPNGQYISIPQQQTQQQYPMQFVYHGGNNQNMNYGMQPQYDYNQAAQQQMMIAQQQQQQHLQNVIKNAAQIVGSNNGKAGIFEKVLADTASTTVQKTLEFEKNGNKTSEQVQKETMNFNYLVGGKKERFKELLGNSAPSILPVSRFLE